MALDDPFNMNQRAAFASERIQWWRATLCPTTIKIACAGE
jgi:hypothetical protein